MQKTNPAKIIKTMTFQIPLDELQGWRRAAASIDMGVVRWLRNLANEDIKRRLAAGQIRGGGEAE